MPITFPHFCTVLMLLIAAVAFSPAHAQEAEAPAAADAPAAAEPTAKPEPPKAAPKKKTKKDSADFKKKHSKKKKPKPAPLKDASVSEPTEDIQAIKNRAEKQFWEGKKKDSKSAAPGPLERASASQLAGVTFDDQPVRMPESDAFRKPIDTVAYELGRPCRSREYLGWPLQQTEQARVDRIFAETVEKFRQRGYSVEPRQTKSASEDISVFTADQASGEFDKHILGLWTAGDAGLLLMLCETENDPQATAKKSSSKPANTKAAAKKSPAKKAAAKKPAAKLAEPKPDPLADQTPSLAATPVPEEGKGERPVIMPGVAPPEPVEPPPPQQP